MSVPVKLNEFSAAVVPSTTSNDIKQALRDNGLHVVEYKAEDKDSRQAAFDEAIHDSDDVLFREDSADAFYSNAEHAVESISQKKATPEQWLKMIQKNGGLKAGEDKWLGLSDWLKSSDKKALTKDEVLDYIRQNEIKIEEVKYEQKPATIFEAIIKDYGTEFFHAFDITEQNENSQFDTDIVDIEEAVNMYNKYNDAPMSLAEYDGKADNQKLIEFGNKIAHEAYDELNAPSLVRSINSTRLEYTTHNLENKKEIVLTSPSVKPWHADDDIHFGEAGEGRAVAWVRFGETTDSKGNRVLVIDEIQSNRH